MMTPATLADILAPQVRAAAEASRRDILAPLTPMQRVLVKAGWKVGMAVGVPAAIRVVVEFLVVRYRADLEPTIGEFVDSLAGAIDEEHEPKFAMIRQILEVLRTPVAMMSPAVRVALGDLPASPPDDPSSKVEL